MFENFMMTKLVLVINHYLITLENLYAKFINFTIFSQKLLKCSF